MGDARMYLVKPIDKIELKKTISKVKTIDINFQGEIFTFYTKMLDEGDPIKKFLFGYFCMELIINKLFRQNKKRYDLTNFISCSKDIKIGYGEMQKEYGMQVNSIQSKFLMHAFFYWKNISMQDFELFKKIKKARNDLAHGHDTKGDSLPIIELEQILSKIIVNSFTDS